MIPLLIKKNKGKIPTGRDEAPGRGHSTSPAQQPAPSRVGEDRRHTVAGAQGGKGRGRRQGKKLERQVQARPRALSARLSADFVTRLPIQGAPRGWGWPL